MKTLSVRVIPNARKNSVEEVDGGLKLRVTAPAVNDKANTAVVSLLSDHFGVRKSTVQIIKGRKSRNKIVTLG